MLFWFRTSRFWPYSPGLLHLHLGQRLTERRSNHEVHGQMPRGNLMESGYMYAHHKPKHNKSLFIFKEYTVYGVFIIWRVLSQKQFSRAGTHHCIPQILLKIITCPRHWYMFLAQRSSYVLSGKLMTGYWAKPVPGQISSPRPIVGKLLISCEHFKMRLGYIFLTSRKYTSRAKAC